MPSRPLLSAVLLALLLSPAMRGQCRSVPLAETVNAGRIVADSSVSGLVQLGQQTNICFGIEVADLGLLSNPVSIDTEDSALGSVIRGMLPHDGNNDKLYDVTVENAVVVVRPVRPHVTESQLDTVVPQFKIGSITVPEASLALFFALKRLNNPSIQGFAGDYSNRFPQDKVLPIDEQNRTAREILTKIVGNSHGGAWVAGPCSMAELKTSGQTCWTVLEYRNDADVLSGDVGYMVRELRQRLARPKKPSGNREGAHP